MQQLIDEHISNDSTLSDVLSCVYEIPECQHSISKPELYVGEKSDYCGKTISLMWPQAAEDPEIPMALFEYGVGTLILPYASEDVVAQVKEQNIGNIIILGHVTADSIGMNAVLSHLENQGTEVIRLSGIVSAR